jgi:IS5 family transposase
MSHQLTFADCEFNKRRKTRREIFLSRMNELIPWDQLEAIIEPFYPKPGSGRRPYLLSTMFRIHYMQHWYNMSDPAMEDALYEITSMRLFAGLSLDSAIPGHTTIMNFRHLLEKHKLSRQLFNEVNQWLSSAGIYLKEGTIVDATIIKAASSTKNKANARDPEMHQTQKGKQWFFGLKAHIGVDTRTGLAHSVSTATANVHDITETANFLHGEECFVSAGSGYRGAQKREELKDVKVDWLIAEIPSKIRILKKHPRKNKQPIRTEYIKASIRAKVEHPFRIIKCEFGFRKANYRGLAKNDSKLAMLFALANVFRIDQMIRAARG